MSIEEKDLAWLCTLLASAHAKIPLLESVFVLKDEIVQWVYSTKSGKVKRRNIAELHDKSAIAALNYFVSMRRSVYSSSEVVCTLIMKGGRVPVDWDKVEEPAVVTALVARCMAIQNVLEDTYSPPIYEVTLTLQDSEYLSSFLLKRPSSSEPVSSPRLWYKVLSLVKFTLRLIERSKRKLVIRITLEFLLSNTTGEVYLCGCPGLTVVKIVGKRKGNGENYRFGTPVGVREGGFEGETEGSKEEIERFTPSGFLPKLHRGTSSVSGFENANFRELLALNYAKNKPKFQFQSFDAVFRKIDEDFLRELSEERKNGPKSPSKADRDLPLPIPTYRRTSKLVINEPFPCQIHTEKLVLPAKAAITHAYSSPTASSTFLSSHKHRQSPSLMPVSSKLFAKGQLDPISTHKRSLTNRKGETFRPAKFYFTTLKL